jgi:hypothetical protein
VAFAEYRSGAASWRPRPLTPGRAVLGLLRNTLSARFDPEGAIGVLTRAVASARLCAGGRGEADEAAERLLAALEEEGDQERRP